MGNILTTPGRRIPDSRVNSVHFIRHYSGHLIWFLFFPVIRCFNSGDSQIDLRTRKQRIIWKQILNWRGENGGEIEEKTRRVCKSAKISCFPNTGIMCLLKEKCFLMSLKHINSQAGLVRLESTVQRSHECSGHSKSRKIKEVQVI